MRRAWRSSPLRGWTCAVHASPPQPEITREPGGSCRAISHVSRDFPPCAGPARIRAVSGDQGSQPAMGRALGVAVVEHERGGLRRQVEARRAGARSARPNAAAIGAASCAGQRAEQVAAQQDRRDHEMMRDDDGEQRGCGPARPGRGRPRPPGSPPARPGDAATPEARRDRAPPPPGGRGASAPRTGRASARSGSSGPAARGRCRAPDGPGPRRAAPAPPRGRRGGTRRRRRAPAPAASRPAAGRGRTRHSPTRRRRTRRARSPGSNGPVELDGRPHRVECGADGPASSRASAVGSMPPGVRWNRSSWNAARSRRQRVARGRLGEPQPSGGAGDVALGVDRLEHPQQIEVEPVERHGRAFTHEMSIIVNSEFPK